MDIEAISITLPGGEVGFQRDGRRKVLLKCMPSTDAAQMENYIKLLKRR